MVKVSILGSTGVIGKNVAFTLARTDTVDEIVLFAREGSVDKAKGETFDMYDALAAEDIDCKLNPTSNFEDIKNSAIVLITSGIPRKEGMKRLDLAVPNAEIVWNYSKEIAKYAPDSIILIATNPVDVMTTVALKASGFKKSKVIGEHGDHMVPLLSSTTIGGIPLKYFVEYVDLDISRLVNRLKKAGNTIISKKGATEYGPSYAISNLISTIINDTHKILTVTTYLDGEIENVEDVSLGVPVVLSKRGVAMIVPIHMNHIERKEFKQAARVVRKATDDVLEKLKK